MFLEIIFLPLQGRRSGSVLPESTQASRGATVPPVIRGTEFRHCAVSAIDGVRLDALNAGEARLVWDRTVAAAAGGVVSSRILETPARRKHRGSIKLVVGRVGSYCEEINIYCAKIQHKDVVRGTRTSDVLPRTLQSSLGRIVTADQQLWRECDDSSETAVTMIVLRRRHGFYSGPFDASLRNADLRPNHKKQVSGVRSAPAGFHASGIRFGRRRCDLVLADFGVGRASRPPASHCSR